MSNNEYMYINKFNLFHFFYTYFFRSKNLFQNYNLSNSKEYSRKTFYVVRESRDVLLNQWNTRNFFETDISYDFLDIYLGGKKHMHYLSYKYCLVFMYVYV